MFYLLSETLEAIIPTFVMLNRALQEVNKEH